VPRAAPTAPLAPEVRRHLWRAYPSNHAYRVVAGRMVPAPKLWLRWRAVRRTLPRELGSLADLAASKGWFALRAAREPGCARALGIDVHAPDLAAAEAVRAHLGLARARFERLHLHELAQRVDEHGGPFRCALLLNAYPYLFLGSEREPLGYADHDRIFELLAAITVERVVLATRLDLAALPPHMRARAAASGLAPAFRRDAILAAARRRFEVEERGQVGGVPLLALRAR
jgi:hypothetical protein